MTAPRVEKMSGKFPEVEGKNIPAPFKIHGESRASEKHPERNEDAMFQLPEKGAFGVFDGMGGVAGGKEASNLAKDYVSNALATFPEGLSLQDAKRNLEEIILEANKLILERARGRLHGMGTTASVSYIWKGPGGERKAIIANVGDSRVYLFRNGRLGQITLDDSLVRGNNRDETRARERQANLSNVSSRQELASLPEHDQTIFENRNQITQYLGDSEAQPRMHAIDLFPGDKLVACSDGVSDNLTDAELENILRISGNDSNVAKEIVKNSLDRSRSSRFRAKKDDMTAIVVEIPSLRVRRKEQKKNIPEEKQENNVGWRKGMLAPVRRGDGKIEYWPIDFIEADGKKAIVSKPEPKGKKRIKEVSLDLIPKEVPGNISRAKSEVQLYYILERLGGIQGSQEFFSSERIIDILKAFFSDGAPVDGITELHGLRQIAIGLKDEIKKLNARERIDKI